MRDVKVADIMATDVHHVSPRLGVLDLETDLSAQRISGAPVVDRGRVVGIVSRSDVDAATARERSRAAAAGTYHYETDPAFDAPAASADPSGTALESLRAMSVGDIMTKDVISVAPDTSVVEVAALMRTKRIHRVLVLEHGALRGLVSSLDIVGVVADSA